MFKGLLETNILLNGTVLPMTSLLVSPQILSVYRLIAEQDPLIYFLDVKMLISLMNFPDRGEPIPYREIQDIFSCGQVSFPPSASSTAIYICESLFNWINRKTDRQTHYNAMYYIQACYTRHSFLPSIPKCLAPILTHEFDHRLSAINYYSEIWRNTHLSNDLKRILFVLICRGYCLKLKGPIILPNNRITMSDLDMKHEKKWALLSEVERFYDLLVCYSDYIRGNFFIQEHSYKRPRSLESYDNAIFCTCTSNTLIEAFNTWASNRDVKNMFTWNYQADRGIAFFIRFLKYLLWFVVCNLPPQDIPSEDDYSAILIIPLEKVVV